MIAYVLTVAALAGISAAPAVTHSSQAVAAPQAAPASPPAPAQKPPVPPRPRTSAAQAAPAPTTPVAVTVTDLEGAVLSDVVVALVGSVEREVRTSETGFARLQTVPAGTWRLRFSREGFHTFEKELVWRAGQPAPTLLVTLSPAPAPPPPPPPPPAPEPVGPVLPPPGTAKTLSALDFLEKNFIGARDAHREDMVGCSGLGQSVLWQIREPWTGRVHPDADAMLYVIGGEGAIAMEGRDTPMAAGGFAVVPRGTSYGLTRRGRNPLIVLAFLAGVGCPTP